MKNNEVYGMSCEKIICDIFNDINSNKINNDRIDIEIMNKLKPLFETFFNQNNINKLIYVGYKNNEVDFIDDNNKTYSIKSNINKCNKLCPQNIGQITKNKFLKLINDNNINTDLDIKNWIIININKLLGLYYDNLFCCDYLIYIKNYNIDFCKKSDIFKKLIENNNIIFTKNKDNWNESNTVKIKLNNKTISIGEFQFHKNRNCIKFRFNINNLNKIIIL